MDRILLISRNRNIWTLCIVAVWAITASGCAQTMAYRQPEPLNRDFLQPGVERPIVVAVLGPPISSEERTNENLDPGRETLIESYTYVDGGPANHWLGKTFRILLYTAGDVFTAFLSQAIWIPAELLLDGTEYVATVDYERGPSEPRWAATRIMETNTKGKEMFVRVSEPAVDIAEGSPDPAVAEPTVN